MNIKHVRAYLMVCALTVVLNSALGLAQQNSEASKTNLQQTSAERDGQHDFDPLIGSWKYHLKRRLGQWRLYWANSKNGIMDPPQVGEFKDGRGEFFAQDTINGKTILIRFVWTNMTTSTPHFEQSFSDDGGKTWEVNWITDQTRVGEADERAVTAGQLVQPTADA